jgi:hypothetical protein
VMGVAARLKDMVNLFAGKHDGRRSGRLARVKSPIVPSGSPNTCSYRNTRAFRAWFWVLAAT